MWYSAFIVFVVFNCFCQITNASGPKDPKKVVCYYASWSAWRKPYTGNATGDNKVSFSPNEIDPSLCTHLIYLYAVVKEHPRFHIVPNARVTDLKEPGEGFYEKVAALKATNPTLKVLLCIGGWKQGSEVFSKLVSTQINRQTFARNVVTYLRKNKFDGLDVFWRYPGQRGGSADDKKKFPLLLQELKTQFKEDKFLLSVLLNGKKGAVEQGYDLPEISQAVDWISIYGHAYNTPGDKQFGISAPLDSQGVNVKTIIETFLETGISNDKLLLGLGTMGFGYTNTDKPGQVTGLTGLYKEYQGFLAYHEICSYSANGWNETWDDASSTPVLVKDNNKVSYDNERSMKLKVELAFEKFLAGVAVWTLDTDDYAGVCNGGTKYPLLRAINDEYKRLIAAFDIKAEKYMDIPHHKQHFNVIVKQRP